MCDDRDLCGTCFAALTAARATLAAGASKNSTREPVAAADAHTTVEDVQQQCQRLRLAEHSVPCLSASHTFRRMCGPERMVRLPLHTTQRRAAAGGAGRSCSNIAATEGASRSCSGIAAAGGAGRSCSDFAAAGGAGRGCSDIAAYLAEFRPSAVTTEQFAWLSVDFVGSRDTENEAVSPNSSESEDVQQADVAAEASTATAVAEEAVALRGVDAGAKSEGEWRTVGQRRRRGEPRAADPAEPARGCADSSDDSDGEERAPSEVRRCCCYSDERPRGWVGVFAQCIWLAAVTLSSHSCRSESVCHVRYSWVAQDALVWNVVSSCEELLSPAPVRSCSICFAALGAVDRHGVRNEAQGAGAD